MFYLNNIICLLIKCEGTTLNNWNLGRYSQINLVHEMRCTMPIHNYGFLSEIWWHPVHGVFLRITWSVEYPSISRKARLSHNSNDYKPTRLTPHFMCGGRGAHVTRPRSTNADDTKWSLYQPHVGSKLKRVVYVVQYIIRKSFR